MVSASSHDGDRVEFKWFQQWYPVLPVSYLDQDKPNKYRVLGLDVVLWPDQDGKWRAAKDVCPHRQALLRKLLMFHSGYSGRLPSFNGSSELLVTTKLALSFKTVLTVLSAALPTSHTSVSADLELSLEPWCRLAALSEGWLESGQLQCRYHGWTYNTSGQCVACPQASPELEHKLTQGERGNLQTYPTLVGPCHSVFCGARRKLRKMKVRLRP